MEVGMLLTTFILCAVLLVFAAWAGIWLVRSRYVDGTLARLCVRLAAVQARIDYLEDPGQGKKLVEAGSHSGNLESLRVQRATIQADIKLIKKAQKRVGKKMICPDASCRHENAADAKHCARCGRELA